MEYQPDWGRDSIGDDYWVGSEIYINVAAARAFAPKRKVGYSDDVRDCLERVRRAVYQIHGGPDHYCMDFLAAPAGIVSDEAIAGLVLVELFRVRFLEGRYAESLRLLADGIQYYATAVLSAKEPVEEVFEELVGHLPIPLPIGERRT